MLNQIGKRIFVALIAVLFAALIRKFLLAELGNGLIWLTFYPAVMVAALFGGFFVGMITVLLSCSVAIWGWSYFVNIPFISIKADWIGLFVFIFNCTLVSGIAEYSRQLRKKANEAKESAELANRSKSVFLANMSHELRTPLNSILGFTQIMQADSNLPETERNYIGIINKSGTHLLNLINGVLDISKIEAGQMQVVLAPFNLQNAIGEVLNLMMQRAESKNLEFRVDIDSNLPTYIISDELKLRQVLLNLLGNAIKFTSKGSVQFSIHVNKVYSPEKIELLIEILDTGIGIALADIEKIFLPFIQSGNNNNQTGTGLGLTISKQYVELLNGSISAQSELGVFSKFVVRLPVQPALKTNIDDESNKFQFVSTIEPNQENFKILIVEDQLENWLLLQRILMNVGIQSQVAENGVSAIEIFKTWQPQLIFMDVRMPVMDGIEATRQIRKLENGNKTKIVGVSAHVFQEELENILKIGMNGFIKKPYQFYEIYESLHQYLGVQFMFKIPGIKTNKKDLILTPEMLATLDADILIAMRQYLIKQDNEGLKKIIKDISVKNENLANTLQQYLVNLRYTEVYRLLNQIIV